MKYLINTKSRKNRKSSKKPRKAHIWVGKDTACRMYSTNGLSKNLHTVEDSTLGLEVCALCSNADIEFLEKASLSEDDVSDIFHSLSTMSDQNLMALKEDLEAEITRRIDRLQAKVS